MAHSKPTIFISYSHKDEPDPNLSKGDRWLTFVMSHLQPAIAHEHFEVWNDQKIEGGGDWKKEINDALDHCSICILLVSRHSLTSKFILDVELRRILERKSSEGVRLYPIVLTSCDLDAASWLKEFNLRPKDATALEMFDEARRNKVMADLAAELREILTAQAKLSSRLSDSAPLAIHDGSPLIDISRLPETPYKRLVGRDDELTILNSAIAPANGINVLSLIAWGGSGKTTLVNEWIARLQREKYRDLEAVLGWSFYDQGTKERASSADLFFDWALKALGVSHLPKDAGARGEMLANILKKQRILLLLDGVEPLQYGPGSQEGLLKDIGLRSFLRRFASEPNENQTGLVVLTSRLSIKDLGNASKSGVAKTVELEHLSEDAGAELLADNGVIGSREDLRNAAKEFSGHALALSLLAGFLARRHGGDVRRRDSVGPLLAEETRTVDELVHGHAKRVMRSIESEWLQNQPILKAIMFLVSLFDRPAKHELLEALIAEPTINGLTDILQNLPSNEWSDALSDLRAVHLLSPVDTATPDDLDTHPIIRDWFGNKLFAEQRSAWRSAHKRIAEHLKSTTREGDNPTLQSLQPLYQAVGHACKAGEFESALATIYIPRISRVRDDGDTLMSYAMSHLGAVSTEIAALSHFFERPFDRPASSLSFASQKTVLHLASTVLFSQGRLVECARTQTILLGLITKRAKTFTAKQQASVTASNLAVTSALIGQLSQAFKLQGQASTFAMQTASDPANLVSAKATLARLYLLSGEIERAWHTIQEAEIKSRSCKIDEAPDAIGRLNQNKAHILAFKKQWGELRQAALVLTQSPYLGYRAIGLLYKARAEMGEFIQRQEPIRPDTHLSISQMYDEALNALKTGEETLLLMEGLVSQARSLIVFGNSEAASRVLDEAEEIAVMGAVQPFLVEISLCRTRVEILRLGQQKNAPAKSDFTSALQRTLREQWEPAKRIIDSGGYRIFLNELNSLREHLRETSNHLPLEPLV